MLQLDLDDAAYLQLLATHESLQLPHRRPLRAARRPRCRLSATFGTAAHESGRFSCVTWLGGASGCSGTGRRPFAAQCPSHQHVEHRRDDDDEAGDGEQRKPVGELRTAACRHPEIAEHRN